MLESLPIPVRAWLFVSLAYGCAALYLFLCLGQQRFVLRTMLLWVALTSVAFLSGSMLALTGLVAAIALLTLPARPGARIVYYFALLPVLPAFVYEVPGVLPGMRYLLDITYPNLLVLFILVPLSLGLLPRPGGSGGGSPPRPSPSRSIDAALLLYALLLALLAFRYPTVTASLRAVVYVLVFELIVPYFVISRLVRDRDDFTGVFLAVLVSGVFLAFAGIFEQYFHWWFFAYLPDILGFKPLDFIGRVLFERGGLIRIRATMDTIPLGYFMALAIGALLLLRDLNPRWRWRGWLLLPPLAAALLFTGSRGAWLTAVLLVGIYLVLKTPQRWLRLGLTGLGAAVLLALNPIAERFSLHDLDAYGTFDYRMELLRASMDVVRAHPWLGSVDPLASGALDELRQPGGLIDVVNSYLQVAFHSGLLGLALFVLIFLLAISRLLRTLALLDRRRERPLWLIGNMLLAMLLATVAMIATVSSISFIPIYYWALVALGSAYARLVDARQPLAATSAAPPPGRPAATRAPASP